MEQREVENYSDPTGQCTKAHTPQYCFRRKYIQKHIKLYHVNILTKALAHIIKVMIPGVSDITVFAVLALPMVELFHIQNLQK